MTTDAAIRVVGLDLSFTKAGVALPDGRLITLRGPTSAGGRGTYERLFRHATTVVRTIREADPYLVVLEDYAPHSPGVLSTIRAAEVGGLVRSSLWRLGIRFETVRPNELKHYATGRGNADKATMIAAALERGARLSSVDADDEADAYFLRLMALDAYAGTSPLDRSRLALAGAPR
jgi:crossover junction endodeoxyribonuclease RuvC